MKPVTLGIPLILLLGLAQFRTAAAQQSGNLPAGESPSGNASCVLIVGRDGTPIQLETLEAILGTTGVFADASRRVLGSEFEDAARFRMRLIDQTEVDDHYESTITLLVWIERHVDGRSQRAVALMNLLCEHLRSAFDRAHEQQRTRSKDRLAVAMRQLAEAEQRVAELQERRRAIIESAGTTNLSRDHIFERISRVEEEKREHEVHLVSMSARWRAIEEQIAHIGEQIDRQAGDDVEQELEKVLQFRIQQLDKVRKMHEAGVAPADEVHLVEEAVARAKIEMLNHRQHAAETRGGELLGALTEEMARLLIDSAEAEARLDTVAQQLEQLKAGRLLELADEYETQVTIRWDLGLRQLEVAHERAGDARRRFEEQTAPSVTVIGGGSPGAHKN